MNIFKRALSRVGGSIMPTVTGFLAGGPMGAGAAFAGSMLLGGGAQANATLPPSLGIQLPQQPMLRGGSAATRILGPTGARRLGLGGGGSFPPMLPSHTPGGVTFDPSYSGLPNLGVYQLPPANRSLSPQEAQDFYMRTGGLAPRGYHITRAGMMVRNRHMNVLNPRALGRALRRAHGFARFAKRVIRVVEKPQGHRFKMGARRRKRA